MMKVLITSLALLMLYSCGLNNFAQSNPTNRGEWRVPSEEVLDGGPGKDGIPSVDLPKFVSISEIDYLNENDLVVGIKNKEEIKAYPHPILDWHEIVNDHVDDVAVAITYCPLTGTAIAWNREINGQETTFGVSGKLYNSNLIPYDRVTDSYWSQADLHCINGSLLDTRISTTQVVETTWEQWKKMFPESKILSTETGFNRNYGQYPYGDFKTNHDRLIFPVNVTDNRLNAKERVLLSVESGIERSFPIKDFGNGKGIEWSENGKDYIIIGSNDKNFAVIFENTLSSSWEFMDENGESIARDETGNEINIFGDIIAGPREGDKLLPVESFIGYWFAIGAFYPNVAIHE